MSYDKALKIIEDMEDKRLSRNRYYDFEAKCPCAVGALIPNVKELPAQWMSRPVERIYSYSAFRTAMQNWGISVDELVDLQEINDQYIGPKYPHDLDDRYQAVLSFLRRKVNGSKEAPKEDITATREDS